MLDGGAQGFEDQARHQAALLKQQARQREEQARPRTQQLQPQTVTQRGAVEGRGKKATPAKQPHLSSALEPGFVAERSNQIWSDVASQRSESYAQTKQLAQKPDKQAVLEQNHQLIRQMNARGEAVLDDRQSEKSFKSFTQISQQQKYSKNEPNFDFSSDEIWRKPEEK